MVNKKAAKKAAKEEAFSEEELDDLIEMFLEIEGPDEKTFKRLNQFIRLYFSPTVTGLNNIPDEPTLFIGNHAMFGLDGMILMPTVFETTGRFMRAMADKLWFQTPTGEKLASNGIVLANPKVCSALMDAGHDILVFPGGAAEANKIEEEKYTLVWRERYGFVRMAALHGYNIVPFGLVGPDDWYDRLMEGHELRDSKAVKLLQKFGILGEIREDIVPPIPKGMFNTLLPKPQKCYLAFGEVVEVPDCRGKKTVSKAIQKSVRAETAERVEALVADMLQTRSENRHTESALRRYLTR